MTVPAVAPDGGRGAFSKIGKRNGRPFYEYKRFRSRDGSYPTLDWNFEAVAFGVDAIQRRVNEFLAYWGQDFPLVSVNHRYGPQTTEGVRSTQRIINTVKPLLMLKEDGVVGPITAEAMWHDYYAWLAALRGVPVAIQWAMSKLESGFDPGAFSRTFRVDSGPDRGLFQINWGSNPGVSVAQAFDPLYSIDYACKRYAGALLMFDGKGAELQTACSIAQHNNPAAALRWFRDGVPPPPPPGGVDIAKYVEVIQAHADLYVADSTGT